MGDIRKTRDGKKLYPVGDHLTFEERKDLAIDFKEGRVFHTAGIHPDKVAVISTGEYRCPKKGEWYISGAIPTGYRALNDFTGTNMKYHIGRLVKVKTTTTIVHEVEHETGVT